MAEEGKHKGKEGAGEGKHKGKEGAGEGKHKGKEGAGEGTPKTKEPAAVAKPKDKETRTAAKEFIQKANGEQLLQLARQTALAVHPLVTNYDKQGSPAYFQKEQDLRRLMYLEQKNHADFRNRVSSLIPKDEAAPDKA